MTEFSVPDLFMPLVDPTVLVGTINSGSDILNNVNATANSNNSNDKDNDSDSFISDLPLNSDNDNRKVCTNYASGIHHFDTVPADTCWAPDPESSEFDLINSLSNEPITIGATTATTTQTNQPLELDASIVNAFFSSTSDSSPMFEPTDASSSSAVSLAPLFDSTGPVVTGADVMSASASLSIPPMLLSTVDTTSILQQQQPQQQFQSSISDFTPFTAVDSSTRNKATTKRVSKPVTSSAEQLDRLGVISYKRKARTQPLLPVVPTSNDPVAIKRARNTEAARRSRARKLKRMTQLEERVEELLNEKCALETEVCRLKELLRANNVKF